MAEFNCTKCKGENVQSILAEDTMPYSVVGWWCHDCNDGFTPTVMQKIERVISTSESLCLDSPHDRAKLLNKIANALEE